MRRRDEGSLVIRVDVAATSLFVLSSSVAAAVFDGWAKAQGVVVALGCFAVGVVAFLWGYWEAVQRSRTDEISVAELYFLMGAATPKAVKRTMLTCLAVQTGAALVTALVRPTTPTETGGTSTGSTLAFGVLVPLLGLGLNGLWAARYGKFGPRRSSIG